MSKKVLIHEVAIREIIKIIVENKLESGDKLPSERDLAKTLNMSRTSIREAIQFLASNYIVSSKIGSGIYVNILDENFLVQYTKKEFTSRETLQAIKNAVEMRILLETYGAKEASKNITSEQLNKLYSYEANEYNMLKKIEVDPLHAVEATVALEKMIMSFQPNMLLTSTYNRIAMTWQECLNSINTVALSADKRHQDHLDIILAIEKKDMKMIEKAFQKHLYETYLAIQKLLEI